MTCERSWPTCLHRPRHLNGHPARTAAARQHGAPCQAGAASCSLPLAALALGVLLIPDAGWPHCLPGRPLACAVAIIAIARK